MRDTRVYSDQMTESLRSAIVDGKSGLKDVPGLLKVIIKDECWRERVVERTGEIATFDRFADYITTPPLEGLGSDLKTIKRLCSDDAEALDLIDKACQNKVGTNQHNRPVDNINTLNKRESPTGTDRAYAIRRLRKDRPDLHSRVIAGEMSPHKAMVEAGLRRRTITVPVDVESAARALKRAFTREQVEEIAGILLSEK